METLYESEDVGFECHFLEYFLRHPVYWQIRYANGTVKHLTISYESDVTKEEKKRKPEAIERFQPDFRTIFVSSSHVRVRGELEVVGVECIASYWNFGANATAVYPVHIKPLSDAVSPGFNANESIHNVPLGSPLQLNCSADFGDPEPTYYWNFRLKAGYPSDVTDSGKEFYNVSSLLQNGTKISTLAINAFGTNMEGDYVCTAKNIRGKRSRRFTVNASKTEDNGNWDAWLYLIICFAIIAVLGAVLIALMRKFYIQRGKLSEMEIRLFEKGDEKELHSHEFAHQNAQFMPYNKEYEIKWSDFTVSETEKLGEGAFGVVFKGHLSSNTTRIVAVKSVKAGAEKVVILALLTELKTMIHLGSHENVVKLLGACTEFLREGRAYILVQYCPLGSLEAFLRQADKNSIVNMSLNYNDDPVQHDLNYESPHCLTSRDLVTWGIQISRGMQHLQKMKVIHGDLAARNILLYSKMEVKITDFGLSRQLLNYDDYVKKAQEKLPWRWMALETLKFNVFTLKSDAWSFGVTLWEIFTLGLMPYPGMRWTTEFVSLLEQNLRLHQPQFASDNMYKVMTLCWNVEPGSRPSFQELEQFLLNL